jgi:aromatic ring-opening dioxygenase LigB subunit
MTVLAAVAVPHPPVIFPEVGLGRERDIIKTIESYRQVMKFVSSFKPDTIVLSTPHSELYGDYFHVAGGRGADGEFARFGAPQVKIHTDYDTEFVAALEDRKSVV